jgi:hypothetical protein
LTDSAKFCLPDESCMLRPVRWIGENDIRLYEPVQFTGSNPAGSCLTYYRRCKVFGGVAENERETAGMCDVLDSNLDIVTDFPLTQKGLKWLYKALDSRKEEGSL